MIAQWENGHSSLTVLSTALVMIALGEDGRILWSILSVAQAMIAQWENECISLTVLSTALVIIAQ